MLKYGLWVAGVVAVLVGAVLWFAWQASPEARRSARRARIPAVQTPAPSPDSPAFEPPPPSAPPRTAAAPRPTRRPPTPAATAPEEPELRPEPPPEDEESRRIRVWVGDLITEMSSDQGAPWAQNAQDVLPASFEEVGGEKLGLDEINCGGQRCLLRVRFMPDVEREGVLGEVVAKWQDAIVVDAIENPEADDEVFVLVRKP